VYSSLNIKFEPPVKIGRRRICTTDEAVVYRLYTRREFVTEEDGSETKLLTENAWYDGKVERRQRFSQLDDRLPQMVFQFQLSDFGRYYFGASTRMYHILKFMALSLARSMFPDNFLNATELRIFSKGGVEYAATYSDFVRDGNGARKRMMKARRLFYMAEDRKEQERIRDAADKKERELVPQLAPLIETVSNAGIEVPHPEVNYHLTTNGVVFFEVSGINLQMALREARCRFSDSRDVDPIKELAKMHAAVVRHYIYSEYIKIKTMIDSGKPLDDKSKCMWPTYAEYIHLPFMALRDMILLKYMLGRENECMSMDIANVVTYLGELMSSFDRRAIFDQ
jgi:hypothetical protein